MTGDKAPSWVPLYEQLDTALRGAPYLDHGTKTFYQDNAKARRNHVAYMIATADHETAGTLRSIREMGSSDYFRKRYGPTANPRLSRTLGNLTDDDAETFIGRGYVQITGRRNYTRFSGLTGVDLVTFPDKALQHDVALEIMVAGMVYGRFTGLNFARIDERTDPSRRFSEYRRIINGTDKAEKIAQKAREYLARIQTQEALQ